MHPSSFVGHRFSVTFSRLFLLKGRDLFFSFFNHEISEVDGRLPLTRSIRAVAGVFFRRNLTFSAVVLPSFRANFLHFQGQVKGGGSVGASESSLWKAGEDATQIERERERGENKTQKKSNKQKQKGRAEEAAGSGRRR